MSGQLFLFPEVALPQWTPEDWGGDGVFLATFPEPSAAKVIHRLASKLKAQHELNGYTVAEERLHITLWPYTARESDLPAISQIVATAARITSPFAVQFERVLSFKNRGEHPLVLRDSGGNTTLKAFRQFFRMRLKQRGFKCDANFEPHVTLLYHQKKIDESPIEPVTWTVTELALIRSHVGESRYTKLGQWRLDGVNRSAL